MSLVTQRTQQSTADKAMAAPRDAPEPETPRTLSVEQAARYLGISRSTAYECVRSGSLPSLRFRRRIVIPTVVIDRLLASVAEVESVPQADI